MEQQAAAAERRGITLTATLPDRPIRIHHDAPRVGQVVTNLVGNALKFTRRGGEVRVTARQDTGGGARIEVADTGVGIHPAELPRIFERFYRGSEANEARGTGSGLGLAIVKSIVDMHHGSIEVESRVGYGSRFIVTLPRDPREAIGRRPPGPRSAGRWTILHLLAPHRSTPHPQPRVHPPVGRMPIRPPPPGKTTRLMNDSPTEMNDEPTGNPGEAPGGGTGATGGADPLDATQPLDVERFAPTPDPRPDDRWAWAAPSATPPPDRWYEPAPSEPGTVAPGYTTDTYAPGGSAASPWGRPATPVAPPVAPPNPTPPAPVQRRGGAGVGTIVAASLLSAVLASGGTVLILDRTGALDQPSAATGTGSVQQVVGQQPVTIDESSAVIDAAAKVGPAVVKITVDGQGTDPSWSVPTEGVGSGIIYDASGWILTNRHVITGADKLTVELKDGRRFAGTVYGIDTLTDLAIVKVDATGPAHRPDRPLGRPQDRPAGGRHRQPAGHLLVLGDQRDRLCQGPRHPGRQRDADHQPDPDGRGHQPRQLGWSACSTPRVPWWA